MKPGAALPVREIGRQLGAAFTACYRGGRWFESTAAHSVLLISAKPDHEEIRYAQRSRMVLA